MLEKIKLWGIVALLSLGLMATGYLAIDKYIMVKPKPGYVITPGPIVNAKAEIIIEGPAEIKVGQLARLTVEKSNGKTFKWKVLPATDNFQVYDDGRRAVFSSPIIGEFVFIVASANDGDVDVKTLTIKVTNEGGPIGPSPTPTPVNPATGLAGKVYEWSKSVTSANKKAEAGKLAESFSNIAKQIQDEQLTTADQIIAATKTGNQAALGNVLQSWVPFLEQLQKEMKTQAEAGLLVTPEQHAIMWRQIAEGLTNVAK